MKLQRMMPRAFAVTICALFAFACGSQGTAPPTGAPTQTTTVAPTAAPPPPGSNFQGPVLWECPKGANGNVLVRKVNPSTGDVVDIKTLPNCPRGAGGFYGQIALQAFNSDQTLEATTLSSLNHVGYRDVASGRVTDVTAILFPAVDDFGQEPYHIYPMFDPTGNFVFMDRNTSIWNFFDIQTRKVVKTQSDYAAAPGERVSFLSSAFFNPRGELEELNPGYTFQVFGATVCGTPLWWLNDRQYLTSTNPTGVIGSGPDTAVHIADFGRDKDDCGKPASPLADGIITAMSDPQGNVYFIIQGPNGQQLYQANLSDPSQPRKIPLLRALDVNTTRMFVGWQ